VIYITGHSLGAGVATVFAARLLASRTPYKLALYTFGSPRVGNDEFARALNQQFAGASSPIVRYHHDGDPVPTLPPAIFGFTHVGVPVLLSDDSIDFGAEDAVRAMDSSDHFMGPYYDLIRRVVTQTPSYTLVGHGPDADATLDGLSACD
jgi:hypothetical protein